MHLSTADFFTWVLLLFTGWIAFLSWRLLSRKKRHDWYLSSRHLFQCDRCHLSFVPETSATWCRCPRCNAYCFGGKKK